MCYVTGTGERDLCWHLPSENCVSPGTYALIGAASMLGGVTRMTISLTVIVVEVTRDTDLLLPIMFTILAAKLVGDRFTKSLYEIHIELSGVKLLETDNLPMELHLVPVRETTLVRENRRKGEVA